MSVLLAISVPALCLLLIVWAVFTTQHSEPPKVNWYHVAELEKECFGEIRSPQAMNLSPTPRMDSLFGVSGKQAGEALKVALQVPPDMPVGPAPGSRPRGPWTVGHRQAFSTLTTSVVLTEDTDPSVALDPAYEWVACPRFGSHDVRYVRGSRKTFNTFDDEDW